MTTYRNGDLGHGPQLTGVGTPDRLRNLRVTQGHESATKRELGAALAPLGHVDHEAMALLNRFEGARASFQRTGSGLRSLTRKAMTVVATAKPAAATGCTSLNRKLLTANSGNKTA